MGIRTDLRHSHANRKMATSRAQVPVFDKARHEVYIGGSEIVRDKYSTCNGELRWGGGVKMALPEQSYVAM